MSNALIHYMYRDGYNYKTPGSVIVAGYAPELVERLEDTLDEGEFFLPEEVSFTNLRDGGWDMHYEDADHIWHELIEVEETDEDVTDSRTLVEVVVAFEQAQAAGWQEDAALANLDRFLATTRQGR